MLVMVRETASNRRALEVTIVPAQCKTKTTTFPAHYPLPYYKKSTLVLIKVFEINVT